MPYIYTTLSNDQEYTDWTPPATLGGNFVRGRAVAIKGKANIADKHMITPRGVMTQVTDDELAFLLGHADFRLHMENGFVTYDHDKVDPEVKIPDMVQADNSAPLVPEDFDEKDTDIAQPDKRSGGKGKKNKAE